MYINFNRRLKFTLYDQHFEVYDTVHCVLNSFFDKWIKSVKKLVSAACTRGCQSQYLT